MCHQISKGFPMLIACTECEAKQWEVITFFCCGTLELVIDELSIVSCSYEGVLQHLQVSVSLLLIRTDPMYAKKMSSMYLVYSIGWRFCAAKKSCSNLCMKKLAYWGANLVPMADEELVVEGDNVVVKDEADE
eukprot:g23762.t1